jgi:hypothetical protein
LDHAPCHALDHPKGHDSAMVPCCCALPDAWNAHTHVNASMQNILLLSG